MESLRVGESEKKIPDSPALRFPDSPIPKKHRSAARAVLFFYSGTVVPKEQRSETTSVAKGYDFMLKRKTSDTSEATDERSE